MSHIIQHLVMPNMVFGAPEEMYVRLLNNKVHALMSKGLLLFDVGGRVSFDTFFNSVTVQVWKNNTAVSDLQLHLRGRGRFIVRIGLHRIGHAHRWLQEQEATLSPESDLVLDVQSWARLESGMLYFALEALDSGSLTDGCFSTYTAPQREVKLGIVITHFNRKQWVLPAIARIRDELLSDPRFQGRIELIVVDNSQNITSEEGKGITLIPNKNLGGSGGFTRGLLHLKDSGGFTHCLFMDDDASCEVESIKKTFNILTFAITERLAIAGSMLREVEPYRLFEKGATFDEICRPLKSGMDMRQISDLLFAELIDVRPGYGGWWFFCFEIQDVIEYAFPFFVRGDDSRFSISNNFNIVTMNGIATWGDDFALKAGPLPIYLDTRYHLHHSILLFNKSSFGVAKYVAKLCLGQIFSCNYTSANAVIISVKDFLCGPETFLQDLDASKARAKISNLGSQEKLLPVDRSISGVEYGNMKEGFIRKILRFLSLNGILVPSFFFKKTVVFQHKGFRARLREVFLHKRIHYEYEPNGTGYIAEIDRLRAIGLLKDMMIILIFIFLKIHRVKREYREATLKATTEAFWRHIYSQESN